MLILDIITDIQLLNFVLLFISCYNTLISYNPIKIK
jgi:hypothetical protein